MHFPMIIIMHHDPRLTEIAHVLMKKISRLNDRSDYVKFSMIAFFHQMFPQSKIEKSPIFSSLGSLNTYDDSPSNSFSLFY